MLLSLCVSLSCRLETSRCEFVVLFSRENAQQNDVQQAANIGLFHLETYTGSHSHSVWIRFVETAIRSSLGLTRDDDDDDDDDG